MTRLFPVFHLPNDCWLWSLAVLNCDDNAQILYRYGFRSVFRQSTV